MVELGSVIGDLVWAFIALIGLAFLVTNGIARIVIGIFGCALLVYLAYKAFLDAWKGKMEEGPEAKTGRPFLAGALISLSSPLQIVFWLGIGCSAIATLVPNPGPVDFLVFFLGYVAGGLLWCFAYSGLVGYGRRYITPRLFSGINLICGIVMVYFAIVLFWGVISA